MSSFNLAYGTMMMIQYSFDEVTVIRYNVDYYFSISILREGFNVTSSLIIPGSH